MQFAKPELSAFKTESDVKPAIPSFSRETARGA